MLVGTRKSFVSGRPRRYSEYSGCVLRRQDGVMRMSNATEAKALGSCRVMVENPEY